MTPERSPAIVTTFELGSLYRITWIDSSFVRGWQYPHDGGVYPEPRQIESTGRVVQIESDHIVMASTATRTHAQGVLNALAIPLGCIVAAEVISEEISVKTS